MNLKVINDEYYDFINLLVFEKKNVYKKKRN